MAEFKLGRLRFVWQGEWATGTSYVKDDIVRYGGSSYVCVGAHTAAPDFYTNFDADKWELMTSGLQWSTAPWTAEEFYPEGSVVRYGGKLFVAVDGHTASPDFNTDFDAGDWQLFVDGIQWKTDEWSAAFLYKEGDLVRHGGRVYICIDGHTSSSSFKTDFNANEWQLFTDGVQWKTNPWTASTLYKVGDVVRLSGKTYICVDEHTSSSTQRGGFYPDLQIGKWNLYTDGNQYRGPWDDTEYYWVGDIVRYGAKSFVCVLGHEADTDFYVDLSGNKWELFNDGFQWLSDWDNGTYYKEGDVVKHGGTTYLCVTGHYSESSAVLGFDQDLDLGFWEEYSAGFDWKNQWVSSTYYKLNDIVRYGAKAYICIEGHVGANDFNVDVDASRWQLLVDGQQWKTSPWQIGTLYKEGDLVRYGGRVYICVDGHTSTSFANRFDINFDAGDWQLFSDGTQWKNAPWTAGEYYKIGDLVRYGGKIYVATDDHEADSEQDGGFYNDSANWDLFTDGTEWRGDWFTNTYYRLGDIVRYDGNVYICQDPHRSALTIEQGLELDLGEDSTQAKWDIFSEGFKYKGTWDTDVKYNVNDVVKFGGSLYICVAYHVSDNSSFEEQFWNVLLGGLEFEDTWNPNLEYQLGDIVTYGGYSYVAQVRNTGKIPPGFASDWEILTTGFKVTGEWSPTRSYKVGELVKYGGSSYVAIVETGPGQKPTSADGSTSILWEVVAPGIKWRGEWEGDTQYRLGDAVKWVSNSYICIIDHTSVESGATQPDNDSNGIYWDTLAEGAEGNKLARRGDLLTRDATQNKRLPRGLPGQVLQVSGKDVVWDYFNVVDNVYYVDIAGADEIGRGTSLQTAFRTIKYATEYILEDEASRAPATIFVKTGTFREQLPIIIPANVAVVGDELRSTRIEPAVERGVTSATIIAGGSGYSSVPTVIFQNPQIQGGVAATGTATITSGVVTGIVITNPGSGYTSAPVITITGGDPVSGAAATSTLKTKLYSQTDMFYMRDGSGLRNCTVAGLDVPLSAPNQYLTQRPSTDCAYASLDPGFGPGDEAAWIINRSPYVQNVTTFGNGAVGLKVDGSLHNGGAKTIVCNDFTQVISDGIGVWCTNQGRSECVSVFTYYAHLGYLAESGGVIRGTNGNCSYGTFGVAAEGVDPSEVSRIARVNNRKEEAIVLNTITDGQGIVILEYLNAGEHYESDSTTYTFEGSGVVGSIVVDQVVIQDGGVKEVRVLNAGLDWLSVTNNAQSGDNISIRLSASDVQSTNAYVGERIVLIDGQGIGQYGYVVYFNGGTKEAFVAKESFKPKVSTTTQSSNNAIVVETTSGLSANQPIAINGTPLGGLFSGVVYYVKDVLSATEFTVSTISGGTTLTLTTDTSGTMIIHSLGWESLHGQPIKNILDTTTRYTIEPRVVFSTGEGAAATGVISPGVDEIEVDTAGGYYQTAPTVIISGSEDNALGATATAVISGSVDTVRIRQGGVGYTGTPTVTFLGGGLPGNSLNHATGQANVTGKITSVSVVNGGTGYSKPPEVVITGDDYNNDAYISAKITNVVGRVNITNAGSNYTNVPNVTFSGGGGSGAEAIANLNAVVTGFEIIEGGSDYTSITTTVTIVPSVGDITGSGATATAVIDNGTIGGPGIITGLTLTAAGSRYTKPPRVIISSIGLGQGAEVSALINGVISSVTITQGGSGYTFAPSVTFSSGAASATTEITGSVNELEVINGGTGFTNTAELSFIPISDFNLDEAKFDSNLELILRAASGDMIFGSNQQSVTAGLAYVRSYTTETLSDQKEAAIGAIIVARDLAADKVSDVTGKARLINNFDIITSIINGGFPPSTSSPDPANTSADRIGGAATLRANRSFIQAEVIAWVNDQIVSNSGIWENFTYDSNILNRDIGNVVDSIAYDLLYGGNTQSKLIAESYRTDANPYITEQALQTIAAYDYFKSIVDNIILEDTAGWTPTQTGLTQLTPGTPGDSATVTAAQALVDLINDIVLDGTTTTATVNPTYTNGSVNTVFRTSVLSETSAIQTDAVAWINANYVGAGTVAVAEVNNVVDSITLLTPGAGYTKVPTVSIAGGGGIGALGTVFLNASVQSITVDTAGRNYTTIPTVAFAGAHNFKSIVAGEAYYKNASAELAVSSFQLTQTLAAMEYVKTLASAIATNTNPTTLYQSQLTKTGTSTSNPAVVTPQTVFWIDVIKTIAQNSSDNSNAAGAIADNKDFIVAEVIAWAAANNSDGIVYTETELRKRVKLIVDAVVYDLSIGTTERTVSIGQQYGYLVTDELTFTQDLLDFVEGLMQDIIANVVITSINDENEDQVFPELLATEITAPQAVLNLINLIKSINELDSILGDTGNNSYTNLLLDNKVWIQAEVTEYIKTTYPNFEYNHALCGRDVGYIVEAIAHDVRYAQSAIPTATAATTNVLSEITISSGGDGYGQGTAVTFSSLNTGSMPEATPIITDGVITGFTITEPGAGFTSAPVVSITADDGSGAFARAFVLGGQVQDIRIIRPGSGYNAPPYMKLVDPNNTIEGRYQVRIGDGVLDQPTFVTRGTGYLAVRTFIESEVGYADIFQVGEFVYVQNLTNIPTPGANIQFGDNPTFYKLVTIRDLLGATGIIGGRNLIVANRSFIQRQIIAYVNTTYPTLVYNQELCRRDVGLIIDAVSADLFGDTERGIEAGKSYFRNASGIASITGSQLTATVAAIDKIEDYIIDLVQNIDIPRNQLFELQVKEPNIIGGGDAINPMQNTLDIIRDIIQNGVQLYAAQDALLDNKQYIQAEVIAFVNTTYPEFEYNQELCSRDVGLIIDALAYDVFAGLGTHYDSSDVPSGLTRSREAGVRYYSNASALLAITDQLEQTVAAIEHIGVVANAVLRNVNPNVIYQTSVIRVSTGSSTAPEYIRNRVQDGIDEIVNIIEQGLTVLPQGTYSARLQVSPPFTVDNAPSHDATITIRSKYSQVRISAHDFLNVGTGNKAATNYPGLPVNAPETENEILEAGGGRCFYTSTDQDGNFRVGELFRVEQSTGIATLNADAFNLSGLNELSLGGINIGGTGATITEFSTDSTFFANSDSIVPTQKAIKTFIASQLGSGGGNLAVNAITAGDIQISGSEIATNDDDGLLLTAPNGVIVTEIISSTSTTTGSIVVRGGVGIAENVNIGGDLTVGDDLSVTGDLVVTGNLTVNGDATTLNVGTLSVEDINITIARGAANSAAANGAGITVEGPTTPATFTYANADDSWNSNKIVKAASLQDTPVGSVTRSSGAFTSLAAQGAVTFTAGTPSTNSATGSVVVTGGVGVSENLNVAGTTTTTGLTATGTVSLSPANTDVTLTPTGTGTVNIRPSAAVGNIDNMNIGVNVAASGRFTIITTTSGTASTSTSTGDVIVTGGVGVGGAIYAGSIQNTPIGSTTAASGTFTSITASGTTDLNGIVTIDGANVSTTISPTGTGSVTINPATAGNINNMNVGASTRGTGAFTTLTANNAVTFTANTTSSSTSTGAVVVTGGVGIGGALNVGGQLTVTGDLVVNGTTSTINSTTITVDDIEIELGSVASPTDTTANGGGIRLRGGTDKTIQWVQSTGRWTFNQPVAATSIQGTPIGSTAASTGAFTTLTANNAVTFTQGTASSSTSTGTLVVTGGVGVSGRVSATDLTVTNAISGSITGNAATVTNGVYTSGDQTIAGVKTFSSTIVGSINGNAATVTNGVYTTGNQSISGVKTFNNGTASTNTTTGSVVVTGGVGISGNLNIGGSFSAVTKSFDIEHPTLAGMRLRYASLEGPENGVYVRGRVQGTVIELPDYWTGLVDEASITVNLTPVGSFQQAYVEKIEGNKVYVAGVVDCFYTVYGERKDVAKLVVEYKA
jgi:hypothetical protein